MKPKIFITNDSLKYFINTMATLKLANEVLKKIPNTPIEHNMIIVNYSDEGMCLFDVLKDTTTEILIEFTGTAA
jgi:hypothetical protein